jgi:hypothetical protein
MAVLSLRKHLEANVHGLPEILLWKFRWGTEENHQTAGHVNTEIRSNSLRNETTSLHCQSGLLKKKKIIAPDEYVLPYPV